MHKDKSQPGEGYCTNSMYNGTRLSLQDPSLVLSRRSTSGRARRTLEAAAGREATTCGDHFGDVAVAGLDRDSAGVTVGRPMLVNGHG